MGTTKLTRKEILAEDPIHAAMIRIVDAFRSQGKTIAIVAGCALVVAGAVYFGARYLESRAMKAQESLGRGLSFYHGLVDPQAADDPLAKGPPARFKTDEAKYQAASQAFSTVIADYGSSKAAVIARYYLGLCQLRLGRKDEAIRNLEEVRNNTRDRTVGYLAKKVLATVYMDAGNHKEAAAILEGMIKDPQCELPREALRLDLARVYAASGRREDALKLVKEAKEDPKASLLSSMIVREMERIEKAPPASEGAKPE